MAINANIARTTGPITVMAAIIKAKKSEASSFKFFLISGSISFFF